MYNIIENYTILVTCLFIMFNVVSSPGPLNDSDSDSISIEYDDSSDEYRPISTKFDSENSSNEESHDDDSRINSNGNKM